MLDTQGRIHVVDFGLARFLEDMTVTKTGALVGTPMDMSPEQVTGRIRLDQRTDVYSLGLVLYEMLSLQRPISSPTREGLLHLITTKPLIPIRQRNPRVPRPLENVIHKATAKDPDERYESATAFASDLQSVIDEESVKAHPYQFKMDYTLIYAKRPVTVLISSVISMSIAFALFLRQMLWFIPFIKMFSYFNVTIEMIQRLVVESIEIVGFMLLFVAACEILKGDLFALFILVILAFLIDIASFPEIYGPFKASASALDISEYT
jgi:serine/threonine protein kinase